MLEFVNVSGPSGSKDLQTRRKVRSQAMRDFRRRQREERDALKVNKNTPWPAPSSPALKRATSTCSGSTQTSSGSQSVRGTSPGAQLLSSQKAGERTFQAAQRHQTPRVLYRASSQEAVQQWQYDMRSSDFHLEPQSQHWQPYTSRDPSPSLLQEPSIWVAETEDPFESPAQLQQMLGFCRSYIHWIRPGVETGAAGRILGQAWKTRPCPMLLAACCLASVGHLDAVQPNRPSGNYALYKARVLQDISKRMKSPATAMSEDTLGALACLLSFEMSRGSDEALTHLRGLESMMKVEGCPQRPDMGAHTTMLQTLDVLHAVLFDSQPILTKVVTDDDMFASPDDVDPNLEGLPKLFSSILIEQEYFQATGPPSHVVAFQTLPAVIREAGLLLHNQVSHTPPSSAAESIERYRKVLKDFVQQSQAEATDPNAFELVRCTHSMALIHFNLVAHRVPLRNVANRADANELFDAIRRVRNSTWKDLPYLRLIILLTGAASATDASTKSFYKAELVRSIYQMGEEEVSRIELFILRFIRMRDMLQRTESLAVSAANAHATSELLAAGTRPESFSGVDGLPTMATRASSCSDTNPAGSYLASESHRTTPFDSGDLDLTTFGSYSQS